MKKLLTIGLLAAVSVVFLACGTQGKTGRGLNEDRVKTDVLKVFKKEGWNVKADSLKVTDIKRKHKSKQEATVKATVVRDGKDYQGKFRAEYRGTRSGWKLRQLTVLEMDKKFKASDLKGDDDGAEKDEDLGDEK